MSPSGGSGSSGSGSSGVTGTGVTAPNRLGQAAMLRLAGEMRLRMRRQNAPYRRLCMDAYPRCDAWSRNYQVRFDFLISRSSHECFSCLSPIGRPIGFSTSG